MFLDLSMIVQISSHDLVTIRELNPRTIIMVEGCNIVDVLIQDQFTSDEMLNADGLVKVKLFEIIFRWSQAFSTTSLLIASIGFR